eukprot:gene23420-biopygen1255
MPWRARPERVVPPAPQQGSAHFESPEGGSGSAKSGLQKWYPARIPRKAENEGSRLPPSPKKAVPCRPCPPPPPPPAHRVPTTSAGGTAHASTPAPRPRHPQPKHAIARAMSASRPRQCPVPPGVTGHARATPAPPKPTLAYKPAPCPRHARASVLCPLLGVGHAAWRWGKGGRVPRGGIVPCPPPAPYRGGGVGGGCSGKKEGVQHAPRGVGRVWAQAEDLTVQVAASVLNGPRGRFFPPR